jgi:hypothetical protein
VKRALTESEELKNTIERARGEVSFVVCLSGGGGGGGGVQNDNDWLHS